MHYMKTDELLYINITLFDEQPFIWYNVQYLHFSPDKTYPECDKWFNLYFLQQQFMVTSACIRPESNTVNKIVRI